MANTFYTINSPPFAHELIGDEVIVVNLGSGMYYSLRGTGAEIWGLVDSGFTDDQMTLSLRARYDAPEGELEAGVDRFLTELQNERIVTPVPSSPVEAATKSVSESVARTPFVPPVIEKLGDVQELLILDPIHEVDALAWPTAKARAPE